MADDPVAFWRLDEPDGSGTAVDAAGSFDGTYTAGAGTFTFGAPTGIPHETNTAVGIASGATVQIPYALETQSLGAVHRRRLVPARLACRRRRRLSHRLLLDVQRWGRRPNRVAALSAGQ